MSNLFFQLMIGLGVMALGGYQIWASQRYFKQLKVSGTAATSNFVGLAVWAGFIFGIILILGGVQFLFGMYN
ncbi:hypothetical protein ACFP1L_06750 [Lactiplantibacillus nangangensis]|uniref:Immunity protein n=1 Tax=Lactiplantibacillus nangangensis TaxID=2559917 RepID=A0ABW1SJ54_9LACO|nr:hypothetical protein [Lactiplantibacillus nangangensis]